MRRLLLISVISLCLGACAPGHNDYSDFRNINPDGWSYGDTLSFTPVIGDSVATGALLVALRHSNDYAYRNLWVEIEYRDATNQRRDTLNIGLADIYGRWFGSGFGARYQLTDTVSRHVTLTTGQPVRIRHIMRDDTLRGVDQVGIMFVTPEP
ncbi:MAG: gliding motility lipoprotein GldH [Pseudoflavonifractor sp.]|nr:gliding motility lipoprotein GldH [Pseudoflavonifractor sp.]